jgi:hypothetical protein
VLLAEPPAAANRLVVLLETVAREERHPVAVLPVEAPRPDRRLYDQRAEFAFGEADELLLLLVRRIGAAYLDRAVDQLGEQPALVV